MRLLALFLLVSIKLLAVDYPVIPITGVGSFDYFASIILWLMIISIPFYMLVSLVIWMRNK